MKRIPETAAGEFISGGKGTGDRPDSPYAWYVLFVLFVVYVMSAIDRSIMAILADDIKKAFGLTDSQLGFLHGTAFGIFFALFGYPLGRLLDRTNRTRLLAIGVATWSAMTVLCGLSTTLAQLAVSRVCVAIGETTAGPASISLLSDWFTKRKRGVALGFFVGGFYIGAGISLAIGGTIATQWALAYPINAPFGLEGWQVSFLTLGFPGVILALWVLSLREPARGLSDGAQPPRPEKAWSRFFGDLACVIPPFSFFQTARSSPGAGLLNIAFAAILSAAAAGMIHLTGDILQWLTLALGCYAAFSSAQALRHRDLPNFTLTWGSSAFVLAMIGFGCASTINIITNFWIAPLSLRTFHIDKATSGIILGTINACCGLLGVTFGGKLSDVALRFRPTGRIWVGIASTLLPAPFIVLICTTQNQWLFYIAYIPVTLIGYWWVGAGAATVSELVLPRMRATASTTYFLVSTLIGSGLGPYAAGKISTVTGDLATGILSGLLIIPIAIVTLILCGRAVQQAEATKWERAREAGEPE